MNLKFSLLDEEDLKQIETMLVRAGLRIFRQLAREGFLTGQAQAAAPAAPEPRIAAAQPRPAPQPQLPPRPVRPPFRTPQPPPPAPTVAREPPTSQWPVEPALPTGTSSIADQIRNELRELVSAEEAAAAQEAGQPYQEDAPQPPVPLEQPQAQPQAELGEDEDEGSSEFVEPSVAQEAPREVPLPRFLQPPPEGPLPPRIKEPPAPEPVAKRKKYRSVQQVCKTVADRPYGYIQTHEANELIGGASPSGALSQYVNNREVEAVIVTSIKPPTKGLPGRLMINKESLLRRLEVRARNRTLPVKERGSAPQISSAENQQSSEPA